MKKLQLLFTAAALGAATMASAQIELTASLGYHGGAFANNQGAMLSLDDNSQPTTTAHNYSMGGGIPINVGVGIPIGDNVTLDASFEYRMGSTVDISEVESVFPFASENLVTTTTAKSSQIRFNPSLMFHNGEDGLYGRFGLVLPIGGKTTINQELTGPMTASIELESKGNMSFGALGGMGYRVEIQRDMWFFAELQVVALAIEGASRTMTSYEDSNGNTIDDLATRNIETEYVESVGPDDNQDPDQAMKAIATKTSYGAWGLNVGMRFTL